MNLIQQLLQTSIISSGETLRGRIQDSVIEGKVLENGDISINKESYDSVEAAMMSVLGSSRQHLGGSALQFWTWFNPDRNTWVPLEHARAELESRNKVDEVKTSLSNPLRIDSVTGYGCIGRIGMTICSGKQGSGLYAGEWKRELETDMKQILDWGGQVLITLMEKSEFSLLGVSEIGAASKKSGLIWIHLPIQDMAIPNKSFEIAWLKKKDWLFGQLQKGVSIVIHCRGGLGRTGMIAARILIEMGEDPAVAITKVRAARERAIETYEQEEYLLCKKWEGKT